MPPKAQPPPRSVWANANTNSLQFCTNSGPNNTINNVANQIFDAAHQALTRTTLGAFIFDQRVADKLRRVYAVAPEDIRRVFNYFCRPRGNSPYDAVFGPGPRDYSPMIARTTITAQQILTSRPSYLKAFVVHSRGALNAAFYTNNCAAVLRGEKKFTAFAGYVSITNHGARCSVTQQAVSRIGGGRKRLPNGPSSSNQRGRPAAGGAENPLLVE
ncbi:hypothetical protein COCSADRAFT_165789 [Bipolaris sorokiniana ND90Pr]|uniref:Uncharacterized protein n=1 Tax=Cochliobolus sativus (strain ND90Pr / ATCC 201652) TaxID=665912 RepID=M2RSS4_COCSN|nr:uncharacterized protein COCSADRAFT_165789 [Bipolaris sorokiniana ND90Pr]EMD58293.1 hypothetical protein COCSADRAFT_165789 [Bipolaris sorokiniana ND90Pr]